MAVLHDVSPLTGPAAHHSGQCQSDQGSAGSLHHSVPFVAWSACAAGRASWTDWHGLIGAWRRPH